MKVSCSPCKSMRLFALCLALIAALSFGTFNKTYTESVRTLAAVTTAPVLLLADGTETHGDGHGGHGGGHDGGGQETHGGNGGGGGGKTHG